MGHVKDLVGESVPPPPPRLLRDKLKSDSTKIPRAMRDKRGRSATDFKSCMNYMIADLQLKQTQNTPHHPLAAQLTVVCPHISAHCPEGYRRGPVRQAALQRVY